jgi:hypothetical protein
VLAFAGAVSDHSVSMIEPPDDEDRLNLAAIARIRTWSPRRGIGLSEDELTLRASDELVLDLWEAARSGEPLPERVRGLVLDWLRELGFLVPAREVARFPVFDCRLIPSSDDLGVDEQQTTLSANPTLERMARAQRPPKLIYVPTTSSLVSVQAGAWGLEVAYSVPEQLLARLESGASLAAGEAAALVEREIAITERAPEGDDREARISSAREQVAQGDPVILRDLIPQPFLRALASYLRQAHANGFMLATDPQVAERSSRHNEPILAWLHPKLEPIVERVVGQPIKASYCFLAVYRPGAELEAHRDRPQCAWNLSVCLDIEGDGATPWPLRVVGARSTIEAELGPGDGVLYRGQTMTHARPPQPAGRQTTVCIFHFVAVDFGGSLD